MGLLQGPAPDEGISQPCKAGLAPQNPGVSSSEPWSSAGRWVLCERPIHPEQCHLQPRSSQRDRVCHKGSVQNKPHLALVLSWMKESGN